MAPGLKVGFFAQHQLDDLVPAQIRRGPRAPPACRMRRRRRCAPAWRRWGLRPRRWTTAAKDLSGGEKARLLMGLAAFEAPSLLILDEPTNHLDIDSRNALIAALNDFEGAVILISHDRHLIEATADRLWLVQRRHRRRTSTATWRTTAT
jgi:ATP-binding cassette subfamily F protein 3